MNKDEREKAGCKLCIHCKKGELGYFPHGFCKASQQCIKTLAQCPLKMNTENQSTIKLSAFSPV